MLLVLFVLVVALVFEFINGFHDTANAIATSVATKVLTPRQAITLCATFDLIGALTGTAVATTIGTGLVDMSYVNTDVILCALLAAIAWNLLTWWWGLPSSSSHALIGGLCGATLAAAEGRWSVIRWSQAALNGNGHTGLWPKVIFPMIASPALGLLLGFGVMGLLLAAVHRCRPQFLRTLFSRCQLVSVAWMSFSHGTNDAQKTMGIMTLTLIAGTKAGLFVGLPAVLGFLNTPAPAPGAPMHVAVWIKVICAVTMAAGIATGGWRIIRTMGSKVVKLHTVHGFAAQTTAAAIISVASLLGMPLSTTHVISTSIMGVGATKRFSAVRWTVVERMVWAWVMTLPITGLLGYFGFRLGVWLR